ncbi:hypothetical protein I4U23_023425 [Adineta vaga]|nr:hypothetical protein I4U23_023425 [Adineta vaga]
MMEVNNRFQLFTSITVDEELEKPVVTNRISSSRRNQLITVKQQEQQPPKTQWEIPEYVEKPILCTPMVKEKAPVTKPVKCNKKSSTKQKIKPSVDIDEYEEQEQEEEEEIQSSNVISEENQPIQWSYHPPQPHKFKQTTSNHSNQTMSKFPRTMNVVPKHIPSRGNTKACTHKI